MDVFVFLKTVIFFQTEESINQINIKTPFFPQFNSIDETKFDFSFRFGSSKTAELKLNLYVLTRT